MDGRRTSGTSSSISWVVIGTTIVSSGSVHFDVGITIVSPIRSPRVSDDPIHVRRV